MITLGGKTLSELGLTLQPGHQHPILPDSVDSVMEIPGRHGAWDFGATLAPRMFELPLAWTKGRSRIELEAKAREVATLLVDSFGNPRTVELRFDYEPDKFYMVRYSGTLPIQRLMTIGFFTLPLIAYDPFAYGTEKVFETTITQSPFEIEIESKGTVRSNPVIVLTNQGSNTITNFRIVNEYRLE